MKRACIAVVDATRARVYHYEEESEPGSELREIKDLVNPGRRLKPGEMFSESRPSVATHGGLHRSTRARGDRSDAGVRGTTYDDHRFAHIDEMDSKFAKHIVDELDAYVREHKLPNLILIASPKMLGVLRKANGVLHRDGLALEEVTRDLTNLTGAQLHDQLAGSGLIQPRQRLVMAR
jgi:protein required for attachment to host cells